MTLKVNVDAKLTCLSFDIFPTLCILKASQLLKLICCGSVLYLMMVQYSVSIFIIRFKCKFNAYCSKRYWGT